MGLTQHNTWLALRCDVSRKQRLLQPWHKSNKRRELCVSRALVLCLTYTTGSTIRAQRDCTQFLTFALKFQAQKDLVSVLFWSIQEVKYCTHFVACCEDSDGVRNKNGRLLARYVENCVDRNLQLQRNKENSRLWRHGAWVNGWMGRQTSVLMPRILEWKQNQLGEM